MNNSLTYCKITKKTKCHAITKVSNTCKIVYFGRKYHLFELFIPPNAKNNQYLCIESKQNKMTKQLILIATLLFMATFVSADNYLVKSPDGKIVAELNTGKKNLSRFQVQRLHHIKGVSNRHEAERWKGHWCRT